VPVRTFPLSGPSRFIAPIATARRRIIGRRAAGPRRRPRWTQARKRRLVAETLVRALGIAGRPPARRRCESAVDVERQARRGALGDKLHCRRRRTANRKSLIPIEVTASSEGRSPQPSSGCSPVCRHRRSSGRLLMYAINPNRSAERPRSGSLFARPDRPHGRSSNQPDRATPPLKLDPSWTPC
jgi:hypothetical protein